jgi:glycosyltransferase involved in cell wall biosynthesis
MTRAGATGSLRLWAWLLLASLLGIQLWLGLMVVLSSPPTLYGDEALYYEKAAFVFEHRTLPRLSVQDSAAQREPTFHGDSDWRPFGWPLTLAALHAGTSTPLRLDRTRVFLFQFSVAALLTGMLFRVALRCFGERHALLFALALGGAPWLFGFAGTMGPDSTAAVLTGAGLLLLGTSASQPHERRALLVLVLGVGCLSLAFLLRPEAIALVAPVATLAILLRPGSGRWRLKAAVSGSLVFSAVLALQVGSRLLVAGRLEVFGPVRFFDAGAFRWVHTWFNTEVAAYDSFVYRLADGKARVEDLPARAFTDDEERQSIARAVRLASERGFGSEVDRIFDSVARKREMAHPFTRIVLTRVARTAQMWLNTQTGSAWLFALSKVSRVVRWPVLGSLLALKGAVLSLCVWGIVASAQRARNRRIDSGDAVTLVMGSYVALRTLLVGMVLGWGVHRYMLSAWPGVYWCAMAGVTQGRRRERHQIRSAADGVSPFSSAAPSSSLIVEGLVSVIVPVHNRPRLLIDAVESALAQTYRPIEILVVDDGSTDDTYTVCERLARDHPEVVLALQQGNQGPGAAREAGRRSARGEFLQYLDSDDLLHPEKFAVQVAALRADRNASIAYCETREYAIGAEPRDVPSQRPGDPLRRLFPALLGGRCWQTVSPLFRRSLTDALGPWSALRREEDWEYDARAGALGAELTFSERFLADFRHHPGIRASGDSLRNPQLMADRAEAHRRIYEHAVRAGVGPGEPLMQRFSRELFLLARQCGAAGLREDSGDLFSLARRACGPLRSAGADFRGYRLAARCVGWVAAGKAACLIDGLRFSNNDMSSPR